MGNLPRGYTETASSKIPTRVHRGCLDCLRLLIRGTFPLGAVAPVNKTGGVSIGDPQIIPPKRGHPKISPLYLNTGLSWSTASDGLAP